MSNEPAMWIADESRATKTLHATDPIPYVPYLAAGWNPHPWSRLRADKHHRTFFRFPTREEWTDELRAARDDFDKHPQLGLPLPGNKRQKVLTIYAWNESGEGGIMAPTRGEGCTKLEAVREVFSHPASSSGRR